MNKLNVIIGADLVPTSTNLDVFIQGDAKKLVGEELLDIIKNANIKIYNLETPLISNKTPIKKIGPTLGASVESIKGIKKLSPTYLNLANNHIMDHGIQGLCTTKKILEENNIEYGGIKNNINDKGNNIWIHKVENYIIGIYACCEHEFSIAKENEQGVEPYHQFYSFDAIKNSNVDFLIVLYHGGKEYYPYPSPELQERCRRFIECGADLVVCQHSHCIGSEEIYQGKYIIYGQGNFIFDRFKRKECDNGMLLSFNIIGNHKIDKMNYIITQRKGSKITKAENLITEEILKEYFERSERIDDKKFLKKKYDEFSEKNKYILLKKLDLLSDSLIFKVLNKITMNKLNEFYFNKVFLKKKGLVLQNLLDCEAWSEILLNLVKKYNERNN